jgi:hypothetical protein
VAIISSQERARANAGIRHFSDDIDYVELISPFQNSSFQLE